MDCETRVQSSMYWVKLQNTRLGNNVYFPFSSQEHFHAWYNGYGENSCQRSNYEVMEKGIDMRHRFP